MKWQVTQTNDSVHVGILIVASPGYSRAGPPRCILGLHPGNVLQDIPVGKFPAITQIFGNQFFKVHDNYLAINFRTQARFILLRPGGGI